jgi:hypothetical protein
MGDGSNIISVIEAATKLPLTTYAIEKIARKAKCFADVGGVGYVDLPVLEAVIAKSAEDKITKSKEGRRGRKPSTGSVA